MAVDEFLVERIDRILERKKVEAHTLKMMGGLCYMVDDKMLCGTLKNGLMVRVDPEDIEDLLKRPFVARMLHGKRPTKSFLLVEVDGYDREDDLEFWMDQCLAFNPKAKSSKKRS